MFAWPLNDQKGLYACTIPDEDLFAFILVTKYVNVIIVINGIILYEYKSMQLLYIN